MVQNKILVKSATDLAKECEGQFNSIVAVQNTKAILNDFLTHGLLDDIADLVK